MNRKKLTIFDAGVAFVMSFILAQFTSAIGISLTKFIMRACNKSDVRISAFFDSAGGYLLQALFMNIAFVLVFIWYFKRMDKREVVAKPNSNTFKYVGICACLGIATLFLLSGVLNYFQLFVDKLGFTSSSLTYELNSPSSYIISLISLAVIPAICEELVFRGVLVNALKSKSKIFAVIFSSIMFAIFHFSPSQLIYPICFGLILSIVYLRTNNIIFSMLLHFINNALSLSIQYFSSSSGTFTHSASMLIYAIITFAIWIVAMVYLFKDFKSHCLQSNNQVSQSNHADITNSDVNTIDSNPQATNDANTNKLNNYVFYGSIIIMLCIYIMLLSL